MLFSGNYVPGYPKFFSGGYPGVGDYVKVKKVDKNSLMHTKLLYHRIIRYRMRALSRKSAILDFLQKLPFSFAQNVLGRANFSVINPPFCGDIFLLTRDRSPHSMSIISMYYSH